jgi:protein PsiE
MAELKEQASKIEGEISAAAKETESFADTLGATLVKGFHIVALFAIGAAIVWSAVVAFADMAVAGRVTIEDILLLFIYLELGAMVGIYFKTRQMPVEFLIYVGITVLTRMLIEFISVQHKPDQAILVISGGILLLAFCVLVLRYASHSYPASDAVGPSGFEEAEKKKAKA